MKEWKHLRGNYWTIALSAVEETVAPVVSTEKSNPDTGASDFAGMAMALAVVSVASMAALNYKK